MGRERWAVRLGAARILVFGIWTVSVLTAPVGLYAELPREMFNPPGPLMLLPDGFWDVFLASAPLLAFQTLLVVGCLLCAAGVRPFTPIAVATALLLLLFDGVMKSIAGYTNHAQVSVLLAAIILAAFPAGDRCSVTGSRQAIRASEIHRAALLTIACLITLTYAFIGTRRIIAGGMDVFTGDAILTHFAVQSLNCSAYGFELGLLVFQHLWLGLVAKVGFAAVTLFEILAPLCLLSRRFTMLWLGVMVPFHAGTLLMMNILFWENMLLLLFFLPGVHLWRQSVAADAGRRPQGAAA
jgi:hypothetical protein